MIKQILVPIIFILICLSCKTENTGNDIISQDISVQEAAELNSKGYLYIDLRTPEEIQRDGKISGAITIDFNSKDFDNKISMLPKAKKYIAYCAGGTRSSKAMPTFKKYNIEAYNMLGGYGQWKASQTSK